MDWLVLFDIYVTRISLIVPCWKLKILLEVKIFVSPLRGGVILTRDDLARCSCQGSKVWVFCRHDEAIKHLEVFLECKFAPTICSIIHVASIVYTTTRNMFENWLMSIDKQVFFTYSRRVDDIYLALKLSWNYVDSRQKKNVFNLLYRLFMYVCILFVRGISCIGRKTRTFLR